MSSRRVFIHNQVDVEHEAARAKCAPRYGMERHMLLPESREFCRINGMLANVLYVPGFWFSVL